MTSSDAVALRFREDWGRLVAGLIAWCGDWDLAEECAAEAFAEAVPAWERSGVPDAPLAWLTTVARNRARDRLRRRTTEGAKLAVVSADATEEVPSAYDEDIPDERLRLIFTCCHPALPTAARVALTLRTLCGLTPAEIGRAYLVTEPAMEKRLVRARAKIKHAGIPYRVPPPELWSERVGGVLAVLYLMFNEGYAASSGEALLRVDVSAEAIRLTRSLVDLLPNEPEVRGLLALLLLTDARRPARVRDGRVVPLPEQDRTRWDLDLVAEGARLLDADPPWGPYAVQARIALCHDLDMRPEDTDWARPPLHTAPGDPGHRAQPGRRRLDGAGPRRRLAPGRRGGRRPRRLLPLLGHPCRSADASRPARRGGRGAGPGHVTRPDRPGAPPAAGAPRGAARRALTRTVA
jgi:RNA polymerase sigma-70 factor, ECF subfamily